MRPETNTGDCQPASHLHLFLQLLHMLLIICSLPCLCWWSTVLLLLLLLAGSNSLSMHCVQAITAAITAVAACHPNLVATCPAAAAHPWWYLSSSWIGQASTRVYSAAMLAGEPWLPSNSSALSHSPVDSQSGPTYAKPRSSTLQT
jgi:hypothetical protein